MLLNLKAEMARKGITMVQISNFLNVRYGTVNDKVNGKYRFYYEEALKIKKHFFPEYDLEYLFQTHSEQTYEEIQCENSTLVGG